MGDYNPHVPQILGNEWVPIQEPDVKLDRNVNNLELGVSFWNPSDSDVSEAQFYTLQEKNTEFTTYNQINVYSEGQEALSGPVRKVRIPVRSAAITGEQYFITDNLTGFFCLKTPSGSQTQGDCTVALIDALNGYGNCFIEWAPNPASPGAGTSPSYLTANFAVQDYQSLLAGKRILNVSLLHRGTANGSAQGAQSIGANITVPLQRFGGDPAPLTLCRLVNNPQGPSSSIVATFSGPTWADYLGPLGTGSLTLANDYVNPVTGEVDVTTNALNFGDVQRLWTTTTSLAPENQYLPWTFDFLQQFDDRAPFRRWVQFLVQLPRFLDGGAVSGSAQLNITYLALEVTYCEETRVAVGGATVKNTSFTTTDLRTNVLHTIPLQPPGIYVTPNVPATLPQGNYKITLSAVHPGPELNVFAPLNIEYPKISATRPLYELPTHPSTATQIPFPYTSDNIIGEAFTVKDYKPAIMLSLLNDDNSMLPNTHTYGQQLPAAIYDQHISTQYLDNVPSGTTTWSYIRFWARRYGNTVSPLLARCTYNGTSFSEAFITPADFDQLDTVSSEGWREVTLALDTPLTTSPAISGNPAPVYIQWTAYGEQPGNRWEVLGSTAASVSGNPNGPYGQKPFKYNLGTTAYNEGINQEWGLLLPGGSSTANSTNGSLTLGADIDIRADMTIADWLIPTSGTFVSQWNSTGNQRGFFFQLNGNSKLLQIGWSNDGTAQLTQNSTVAVPASPGERMAVRVTLDMNDGNGNRIVKFYTAPTIDGPWTQLGTTITTAGTTAMFNSNANLTIGARDAGTGNIMPQSTIHAASVTLGSFNLDENFYRDAEVRFMDAIPNSTTVDDLFGGSWAVNGTAAIGYRPITQTISQPRKSDVAVLLSATVPAVSGFAISAKVQSLTGIGLDCSDGVPCCIPSQLFYNRLTWLYPVGTFYSLQDLFDRTQVNSWGRAAIYEPDSDSGLSVSDGTGYIDTTTLTIDNVGYDFDLKTLAINSEANDGDSVAVIVTGRGRYEFVLPSHQINRNITFSTTTMSITLPNGGAWGIATMNLAHAGPIPFPGTWPATPGAAMWIRYTLDGSYWKVKAWPDTIDEPDMWYWTVNLSDYNGAYIPGTASNFVSTPDNAALDITGDIDIRADVTMGSWVTSTDQAIVSKYNATGNQRSYYLQVNNTSKTLQLGWSADGTTVLSVNSATLPIDNGQNRLAVRATLDVSDGSGNRVIRFFTGESVDGPWTQLGSTTTTAGTTSIFNSSAAAIVGALSAGTNNLLTGIVHAVQIRNGIDGTVVANPNFTNRTDGATSFVDSAGRTWSTTGADVYIINESGAATNPDVSIFANGRVGFQNLEVTPPQFWFGATEIQRKDEVETEWKTILKATSPAVSGFNDFEARPGIQSDYRIRRTDVYDFPSAWSSTISATIPAPGVGTGECIDSGHLLLFTTNEVQNGSSNLAYSSVWLDNQVEESFTFPESSFVQMQAMYDRDFFIAFRPLERGGEQFTRDVLVQAAAIPPETLADFTSLRDLAWDDLNYVCVRDEDGNRWLAAVQVPSGNVLKNRRLYIAPVQITEVTETPTPVDPSPWS